MTGLAAVYRGKPETLSKWRERSDRQLKTTQRSFQFIFGEVREKLPEYLKAGDPMKLKNEIKDWVKSNVPQEEKWNSNSNVISSDFESDDEE